MNIKQYKFQEVGKNKKLSDLEIKHEGTSPTWRAIANLVNSVMGIGIVGLPQVVCKLGLLLSTSLLIILAFIASWSANQIIQAKVLTKSFTYEETCSKLLGPIGYWMLNISLWINYLCVMAMYICFSIKFTFPLFRAIGGSLSDTTYYNIAVLILFFIYIPVLLLDDLSVLGFSSAVGMVAVIMLIVLSSIACPLDKQLNLPPATEWKMDYGLHKDTNFITFFTNFGILFMVNNCHFSVSSVHNSLLNKKNIKKAIFWSFKIIVILNLWFSIILYVTHSGVQCTNLFGSSGYDQGYFDGQKKDATALYVNLFSRTRSGISFWFIVVGSLCQSVSISMGQPIIHFFMRELSWSVYQRLRDKELNTVMPSWFFRGHLIFWFFSTLIALFLEKQIIKFMSFVGSFTTPILQLILPVLLSMQINHGIQYYSSFGCYNKRICKFQYDNRKDEIRFEKSLIIGGSKMIFMNILLLFGITQVLLSFKILYNIIVW